MMNRKYFFYQFKYMYYIKVWFSPSNKENDIIQHKDEDISTVWLPFLCRSEKQNIAKIYCVLLAQSYEKLNLKQGKKLHLACCNLSQYAVTKTLPPILALIILLPKVCSATGL